MKFLYIIPVLISSLFISCDTDDDAVFSINETENLQKAQEFITDEHTLELYTSSGNFYTGHNNITIRVKNNSDESYINDANINWIPVMQMTTMSHSCPKSTIVRKEGTNSLYHGTLVFQMTETDGSGWSITFTYTINDITYTAEDTIIVHQNASKNVTTFMGSDDVKYIIALITPENPTIGVNSLTAGLYKMENMMSFPPVSDYSISLDPRMPSMGNHSSPNNTDLSYSINDTLYHGDLSLTMTGYWVLNLKLFNTNNTLLKGEDVTAENIESSLNLNLEF